MLAQHTHPNLASLLIAYLRGQGSTTCLECLDNLSLPPIYRDYAASQDVIGWDGFVTGWVLAKLLPLHSTLSHESSQSSSATRWISGLITQLLLITHRQWIYRCVLVHNRTTGTLILAHKVELLSKIQEKLDIGSDGSMNRIGSCWNVISTIWQLLQGSTKNIGYWQYRRQWRRHASRHSRRRQHSHAVAVVNKNGHIHNINIAEYQCHTCSVSPR